MNLRIANFMPAIKENHRLPAVDIILPQQMCKCGFTRSRRASDMNNPVLIQYLGKLLDSVGTGAKVWIIPDGHWTRFVGCCRIE
jgi:hypothetical protein